MVRFLTVSVCIVLFWCGFIGWAAMFAFADGSHASSVSAILLSPVVLVPLPGMMLLYAVGFWCLVSLLALFRHVTICRYAALGLLLMHWLGAVYMVGRDVLSDGGSASIGRAFRSYPSLSLFVVAYVLTQYYLCKHLVTGTQHDG